MKKAMAATLILSTTLLVGCSPKEVTPPTEPPVVEEGNGGEVAVKPTAEHYYPLTEGNYWKYQVSGQDTAVIEQKVVFVGENKAQIEEVDTSTKAIVYEYQEGDKVVATLLEEEHYDGENILDKKGKMKNVILQGPFVEGTTWQNNGLTYTITSLDEVVSTPAGDFDSCLLVHASDGNGFDLYTYYQPEVGIVKETSGSGEYKVERVLAEYDSKEKQ